MFIAGVGLALPAWWTPSPWRAFASVASARSADPQRYTIDKADFYLAWIDGAPLALSASTPSAQGGDSCQVRWSQEERLFVDPCGGSRFLRDGGYKYGPAPRSLSRFSVRIAGDRLEIDPAHIQPGAPHS